MAKSAEELFPEGVKDGTYYVLARWGKGGWERPDYTTLYTHQGLARDASDALERADRKQRYRTYRITIHMGKMTTSQGLR